VLGTDNEWLEAEIHMHSKRFLRASDRLAHFWPREAAHFAQCKHFKSTTWPPFMRKIEEEARIELFFLN
jgi:hypothetical protein